MPEKNGKQKKKSNHTGAKVVGGAAILAALLGGGYFGLGIGNPGGGVIGGHESAAESAGNPEATKPQETPAQTETESTETPSETQPETQKAMEITVKEAEIWYNDAKVSLADLKDALLRDYSYTQKPVVTLIDSKAVKGTYDEVAALLDTLKIEYTRSTQ